MRMLEQALDMARPRAGTRDFLQYYEHQQLTAPARRPAARRSILTAIGVTIVVLWTTVGPRAVPLQLQANPRPSGASTTVKRQLRWQPSWDEPSWESLGRRSEQEPPAEELPADAAGDAASPPAAAAAAAAVATSPPPPTAAAAAAVEPTVARATSAPAANASVSATCHAMPRTELHGDVVRWGADFVVPSAGECCAACRTTSRCTVWVYCEHPACGAARGQCWLKKLDDPFTDVDLVRGRSDRWTSGTMQPPPAAGQPSGAPAPTADDAHLALVTPFGRVRLRLRPRSARATAWVLELLATHAECNGCTFYRAEKVPAHWGSPDWPDSYEGGRWGPPYALLQGGLSARGAPTPSAPREDSPVVRRGMVAWAGGASGPAFFVALADHPEWGRGHTVFADVVGADMAIVEAIVAQPTRTNPGKIPITNLVTPVAFTLEPLNPAQASSR